MVIPPTVRHALPWLLVGLLGLFGKCTYDGRRRAEGREAVERAAREAAIESASVREDSLRRQFATERSGFNTELARWQALRERVRIVPKWDTLPPDTIPGPERIVTVTRPPTAEEIIEQANRTIGACSTALGTCESRVANLLKLRDSLAVSADYWHRKSEPSLLTRFSTALKWAAIGYVAGKVGG